jgi:hypothetical protein
MPVGRPAVPAAVVRRPPVHVTIQPLGKPETLLATLRNDGWAVESAQDGAVRARHPLASDEGAARSRLQGLGLLTSRCLRIEFCHVRPRPGAGQGS